MGNILAVNIVDIVRAYGENLEIRSPEKISEWLLKEYLSRKGGRFNHNPSISCLSGMYSGALGRDDAIAFCSKNGSPAGFRENVEIVRAVAPHCSGQISQCYKHPFVAVPIGRHKGKTIYAKLKAPLTRVSHGDAFIVLPMFRKTFRPSERQIDAIISFARAQWAYGDFSAADVEALVAKGFSGTPERQLSVILGADRELLSVDDIGAFFQPYIEAVGLIIDSGIVTSEPDLKGFRVVDPYQMNFF